MKQKYLFFDLDGTLKGRSRTLTEKNRNALLQLQKNGHKIFLCSGRSPEFLKRTICQEIPFDGIVGCAGSSVLLGDTCIFENSISPERLQELVNLMKGLGMDYSLENTGGVYETPGMIRRWMEMFEQTRFVNPESRENSQKEENCGATREISQMPENSSVQKICFMVYSKEANERFASGVEKDFHIIYYVETDQLIFGEIIRKDSTKARGIQALLDYCDVPITDTVAFGDSMNDYQMMEYVGTRAVYEHAPEELLALADYRFADPDQDGIAGVLMEMGMLEEEYYFWGWQQAKAVPVDSQWQKIKDPQDLYDILSGIWCEYTCAPRLRSGWSPENRTLGQCSITAFLAQDIFGGKVYGILRPGGNYHCYNSTQGVQFDLTSEQFGDEKLDYTENPEQFREVHFAKEEKRLRYEYLKAELRKYLKEKR